MFTSHFCKLLCRKSKLLVDSGERFVHRFSSSLPAVLETRSLSADEDGIYTQDSTSDRAELWQHCTVLFPFVHGNRIPMGTGIIPIPIYTTVDVVAVMGVFEWEWCAKFRSHIQFCSGTITISHSSCSSWIRRRRRCRRCCYVREQTALDSVNIITAQRSICLLLCASYAKTVSL